MTHPARSRPDTAPPFRINKDERDDLPTSSAPAGENCSRRSRREATAVNMVRAAGTAVLPARVRERYACNSGSPSTAAGSAILLETLQSDWSLKVAAVILLAVLPSLTPAFAFVLLSICSTATTTQFQIPFTRIGLQSLQHPPTVLQAACCAIQILQLQPRRRDQQDEQASLAGCRLQYSLTPADSKWLVKFHVFPKGPAKSLCPTRLQWSVWLLASFNGFTKQTKQVFNIFHQLIHLSVVWCMRE